MGLKETLQLVAQTAIKATGTIRKSIVYKQKVGNPTYTPGTGTVVENESTFNLYAILDQNILEDMPNMAVNSNEKLAYIATSDLTPTPQTGDEITIDEIDWKITEIKTDPADAMWILKIQRQ